MVSGIVGYHLKKLLVKFSNGMEMLEQLYVVGLFIGDMVENLGDANRMAGDVHEALLDIVSEHGGKSREDAEAFVEQLKKDGRYQRDVY